MNMGFYKQGKYKPFHVEKYAGNINNIVYRSSWERKFMVWCDRNPSVIKWNSEGMPISYFSKADGKTRRYFVDFILMIKDKDGEVKRYLIEIKPYAQTQPPKMPKRKTEKTKQRYMNDIKTYQINCDKWKAASKWADTHGFIFKIMTEHNLGIS